MLRGKRCERFAGYPGPVSRVLLTALLGASPSVASAQSPTGYIASIKVTFLRFFETPPPPHVPPRERRVYSTRFPRSQVRRIFWELNLEHPPPGRQVTFPIDAVWYSPMGNGQGHRQRLQASLQRDWTWSYWHDGGLLFAKWKVSRPDGNVHNK
jgi:hypothetical protein